jgi:hypothetical protein
VQGDAALGEIDLRGELARRIALHRESLAQYQAIEQRDFLHGRPLPRELQIQHMILKKGILYEQASIDWTEEMLGVLEAQPATH